MLSVSRREALELRLASLRLSPVSPGNTRAPPDYLALTTFLLRR
jgi:hypothetical protein